MRKLLLLTSFVGVSFVGQVSFAAPGATAFNAKMVAKLDLYIGECNGAGRDPKPKMAEFEKYIAANGLKDAKIECGVSNFGASMPLLTITASDGATYYVNFQKKGNGHAVTEILEDAETPAGTKRQVVWPTPKKAKK